MIGDIIRQKRIDQGYSLREFSILTKINVVQLSSIERKSLKITFDLLQIICFVLKLNIRDMQKEWESENDNIIKRNKEFDEKSMALCKIIYEKLKDKNPGEKGEFSCECGGLIFWRIQYNKHIWALCNKCQGGFIQ